MFDCGFVPMAVDVEYLVGHVYDRIITLWIFLLLFNIIIVIVSRSSFLELVLLLFKPVYLIFFDSIVRKAQYFNLMGNNYVDE